MAVQRVLKRQTFIAAKSEGAVATLSRRFEDRAEFDKFRSENPADWEFTEMEGWERFAEYIPGEYKEIKT